MYNFGFFLKNKKTIWDFENFKNNLLLLPFDLTFIKYLYKLFLKEEQYQSGNFL